MEIIELHRRATRACVELVSEVRAENLGRPTPCEGWDLAALLAHMIGQHHGFADATEGRDVGLDAFAPRPFAVERAAAAPVTAVPPAGGGENGFAGSAERLTVAFAGAADDVRVVLPEIHPTRRFPLAVAVGFQFVDTVVHTWDVAAALGRPFRPDDELVAAALEQAVSIPDGESREAPGAAFAHALPGDDGDDWHRTLRLLGRDPGWTPR